MFLLSSVAALGLSMIGLWHLSNVGLLIKNAIITLTSIFFIQTLSPMVISCRLREKSVEVTRHKALRAMNIAFGILFVTVFFYAVSFTLAMGHDEAVKAYEQNISALAIAAALDNSAVTGNEGIVANDVEQSIANLCALPRGAMQATDRQIIEIMASKVR